MTTTLMAMGGALDAARPVLLKELVRRAGGGQARVVILPQASALADTGAYYCSRFLELGAGQATALEFAARAEADAPAHLSAVGEATAIFIAGGNQMRLPVLLGGTQLEQEIQRAFRRGAVVAGTSAGAAILSRLMIADGRKGSTPRANSARFSAGLGLSEKIVFDQHFRQRDRLGRLILSVSIQPGLLGVGVDEDTAAIVEDDSFITVAGSGAVTIVDGAEIQSTNAAEVTGARPVAVSGVKIHVLTDGCSYDLQKRAAVIPIVPLLVE